MSETTQRITGRPAATLVTVRVADRFFALAHDAYSGRSYLPAGHLAFGLATGLVAELMLGGSVVLGPDGTLRPAQAAGVLADAAGDRVLRLVRAESWAPVRLWLDFLARTARDRVVDRLVGDGVLWAEPRRRGPRPQRAWYPAVPALLEAEAGRLGGLLAAADRAVTCADEAFRADRQVPAGGSDRPRPFPEQRRAARGAARAVMADADLVLAALVDVTGLARTAGRGAPVSLAVPHWLWDAVPHPYHQLVAHTQYAIGTSVGRRR